VQELSNSAPARIVETTYGELRPGQAYRLPGGSRWFRRSANARLTESMLSRVVEISDDP
jgi:hypothetical protein